VYVGVCPTTLAAPQAASAVIDRKRYFFKPSKETVAAFLAFDPSHSIRISLTPLLSLAVADRLLVRPGVPVQNHYSFKGEGVRAATPLSLGDANRPVEGYIEHHNNVSLNSAAGYITP
jgi:hypothetical protein